MSAIGGKADIAGPIQVTGASGFLVTVQKAMPSVPLLKGFGWIEIITVVPLNLIDPDPVGA
jgi:hypothetical protein